MTSHLILKRAIAAATLPSRYHSRVANHQRFRRRSTSPSATFQGALYAANRHFSLLNEFLALRAKMCTALTHNDAFNKCATTHTWPPLLVIYPHMVVVITSFSPQVAVLAEGCPPMLDTQR